MTNGTKADLWFVLAGVFGTMACIFTAVALIELAPDRVEVTNCDCADED